MAVQLRIRRDTLANWELADPVINLGEMVLILDDAGNTVSNKIGNGTSTFTELKSFETAGNILKTVAVLPTLDISLFNTLYFVIGDRTYLCASAVTNPTLTSEVFWQAL